MSITKIVSKRIELPVIFLVETKEDYDELPRGLPFIVASKSELNFITTFLEFQFLYRSCMKTGIPVKWLDCLMKIGYDSGKMKQYSLQSGGSYWSFSGGNTELTLDDFIEDQYLVDFDRLAELKILPKWLDDLRASVETNIIDEVTFDPTAFNKQLGMNIGYGAVKHTMKNLLILDVSGSIPTAVVMTITNLAKLMSKKLYADILITGGKSQLIDYEDVFSSDIIEIAKLSGRSNEGEMYSKIIGEPKEYNTVISFGDDDNPNQYGGKGLVIKNKFKVETLYSLHTNKKSDNVTGYAKIFNPKTVHIVRDWVNTVNN